MCPVFACGAHGGWPRISLLRSLRRKGWIGAILLMPLAIIEQIGGTVRGVSDRRTEWTLGFPKSG